MKTLILYATKHGATREIARRIAEQLDDVTIHDLKHGGVPPVAGFDRVIIGSSIYAGMIRKEAKEFLSQNASALRDKTLGLFLCGMDDGKVKEYFDANFSPEILESVKAAEFMGGIFDPVKAGFFARFFMKVVAKQSAYISTINDEKIIRFAEEMRA